MRRYLLTAMTMLCAALLATNVPAQRPEGDAGPRRRPPMERSAPRRGGEEAPRAELRERLHRRLEALRERLGATMRGGHPARQDDPVRTGGGRGQHGDRKAGRARHGGGEHRRMGAPNAGPRFGGNGRGPELRGLLRRALLHHLRNRAIEQRHPGHAPQPPDQQPEAAPRPRRRVIV